MNEDYNKLIKGYQKNEIYAKVVLHLNNNYPLWNSYNELGELAPSLVLEVILKIESDSLSDKISEIIEVNYAKYYKKNLLYKQKEIENQYDDDKDKATASSFFFLDQLFLGGIISSGHFIPYDFKI
ncbi:hypothetical protein [uncultured Lacinutrix sp.]|uniref:hypothetical protein n=1 Tax=uncultured Lacinutrix sp. TaxID=574032 RepID=UPI0026016D3C|nr:hypothetical protein [uncultured Lacinutrix sp.]